MKRISILLIGLIIISGCRELTPQEKKQREEQHKKRVEDAKKGACLGVCFGILLAIMVAVATSKNREMERVSRTRAATSTEVHPVSRRPSEMELPRAPPTIVMHEIVTYERYIRIEDLQQRDLYTQAVIREAMRKDQLRKLE